MESGWEGELRGWVGGPLRAGALSALADMVVLSVLENWEWLVWRASFTWLARQIGPLPRMPLDERIFVYRALALGELGDSSDDDE